MFNNIPVLQDSEKVCFNLYFKAAYFSIVYIYILTLIRDRSLFMEGGGEEK